MFFTSFIVEKGSPGLSVSKIENKVAFRIMQNGDVIFNNVFIPEEERLPALKSFKETTEALTISRVMVAWQAIGISMGVYDMCHRYVYI